MGARFRRIATNCNSEVALLCSVCNYRVAGNGGGRHDHDPSCADPARACAREDALGEVRDRVAGKNTPYVITVKGDFSEGSYFDVSQPGEFRQALTVPGFPAKAILVK